MNTQLSSSEQAATGPAAPRGVNPGADGILDAPEDLAARNAATTAVAAPTTNVKHVTGDALRVEALP